MSLGDVLVSGAAVGVLGAVFVCSVLLLLLLLLLKPTAQDQVGKTKLFINKAVTPQAPTPRKNKTQLREATNG